MKGAAEMKKIVSIFLAVLMTVTCLGLVACKKDEGSAPSPDSKYIGVWKATSAEFKGESTPIEEVLKDSDYILDLRADGTAIVTTTEAATGTWTEKADAAHVKAGETDTDFPMQGDKLVISLFGAKIIFERQ